MDQDDLILDYETDSYYLPGYSKYSEVKSEEDLSEGEFSET